MLKKISHRNIIRLLDFIETSTEVIIITEYAGENLAEILERKKRLSYEEIKIYCKQILDALCYLDENRIAHRDLKPQNILIKN
jgi:serine/threonine protein kinase